MPISPGADVMAAVQSWWSATPAVQALVPDGRLWHGQAPEDTGLPYATTFLVSSVAEAWTTGYPLKRLSIQVNAHAATDALAIALGVAIAAALTRAPLVIGASPVCHVLPDADSIQQGQGLAPLGRDCWVHTQTYDLLWTP